MTLHLRPPSPLVTCLVCAHNYARFLAAALDSALGQTYRNIEVLVIDDGSTDETAEILASYGARIRVQSQAHSGLCAATALGLEQARGEFIALLDADDVWQPRKLERQVECFDGRPRLGLVYSDMETISADGATIAPSHFRAHDIVPPRGRALGAFLQENFATAPTIMFRRELKDRILPIPEEVSFQDWWIALRAAEVGEIDVVDEPLIRYRIHGDNMTAGASGARLIANVRSDNRFRRWMLRHLDVSQVEASALSAAWDAFLYQTSMVAQHTSHEFAAEVALQGRDPEEAERLLAAGAPLAALCADPLHKRARLAFAGVTARASR